MENLRDKISEEKKKKNRPPKYMRNKSKQN
jgi:hypothetical protein